MTFPHVKSSFLQKIPFATKYHRMLLPLFPKAISSFDLQDVDLIISSSHAVAKGVKKHPRQQHLCYCHTPMRYIWDLEEEYTASFSRLKKRLVGNIFRKLRTWDLSTAQNIDLFLANSHYIANRIARCYHRQAHVLYPPVDIDAFYLSPDRERYFVTHARLVPYKRLDLLIETFTHLPNERLLIIGSGPMAHVLRKRASHNIEFLGFQPKQELAYLLSKARAYLFCAKEDFGISVVEAQSSGLPVIALGQGGVLETVIDQKTGLFFKETTVASILDAIHRFFAIEETFDPHFLRLHSQQFHKKHFMKQFSAIVQSMCDT